MRIGYEGEEGIHYAKVGEIGGGGGGDGDVHRLRRRQVLGARDSRWGECAGGCLRTWHWRSNVFLSLGENNATSNAYLGTCVYLMRLL